MLSVWQRLKSLKIHFSDFLWRRSSRCNLSSFNQTHSWEIWMHSRVKWGKGGPGQVMHFLGAGPDWGASTSSSPVLIQKADVRSTVFLIPSFLNAAEWAVSFEQVMQWWYGGPAQSFCLLYFLMSSPTWRWQFFRFSLFLMTVTVLRSPC